MGPYMIGFDTLGFYVPNTLLWLHNSINLWSYLQTAPLFYAIFMSMVFAGGSPVLVLKIIPPFLLGFLGLSIYTFAKRGLGWSPPKSTFVALLSTVYFVALRASWDQLREELGLVFFFCFLMLLLDQKGSSWKRCFVLSFLMITVVLSHQLVSVIMFGVVVFTIASKLFRKDFVRSVNLLIVSLPSALFFIIVYLSGVQSVFLNYPTNIELSLSSWTGFTSYQSMLVGEAGFFLYCYLPIMPLVIMSLKRFGNLQLRSWLLLSLILLLLPIASTSPYRWVLMLTYPLAFYATETLSRFKSIKWKRFKFTVQRIAALYLVLSTAILSFGFMFMSAEKPFSYFNPQQLNYYVYQIPSSMLQNTISITDCQNTINALQWFKNNANSSALLLTHTVFYGWGLLTLNKNQIIDYGFDDPTKAAMTVAQQGHTEIYLIWWINGQGWYGQPNVPPSFQEVFQSGKIGVYSYSATNLPT
jgi:hypothetical protein